jgi:putative flippase GtrA
MTTQMQTIRFTFPSVTGSSQTQTRTVFFNGAVQQAVAMVQGFEVHYNNGDHHVLQELIQLSIASIIGTTVGVTANFLLRDSSGNIDDPYSGSIDAVVIANVTP